MIVTLTNGKRVANFSSPHEFKFEDGSILHAIENEVSLKLSIKFIETEIGDGDIMLSFKSTPEVDSAIDFWIEAFEKGDVDVVFCPLPMITMLKEHGIDLKSTPFRSIRITDRISKLVSINKQCL